MTRFQTSILVPAMVAGAFAVAAPARAQMSESELVMRINRLENQVRQLTGTNEQLQYRNQQLEEQLARLQQGGAPPAQSRAPAAPAVQAQRAPQAQYAAPPQPQLHVPLITPLQVRALRESNSALLLLEQLIQQPTKLRGSWLLPIEPLLHVTARPDIWARALAHLRNRAA